MLIGCSSTPVRQAFNAVYALKEQLEQLWHSPATITVMGQLLDQWCELAQATGLAPMKRFVAMLQRHRTGTATTPITPLRPLDLKGAMSPSA